MKNKQLSVSIFAFALVLTAFRMVNDIIEQLGMQHKSVQGNIISNLVGNFSSGPMDDNDYAGGISGDQEVTFRLPYIPAPKLSTIIAGDKAAAAKEVCEYIKKYINSQEFMADYNIQRENAMPRINYGPSLGSLKSEIIVYQKNINNYKTDIKYVAEQQGKLDEAQKKVDAILMAAKKPFPGKANWEKKYPLDPSVIVKKRLQEYLQLAATVDFNAALTAPDRYKIKKFVNPAYEKKSLKWKAIYRAGKEVNDVVTAFIKEWLKGEIIAAQKTTMTANTQQKIEEKQSPASNASVSSPSPAANADTKAVAAEEPASKKSGLKKLKEKAGSILRM
jgi:hypothetical protein